MLIVSAYQSNVSNFYILAILHVMVEL